MIPRRHAGFRRSSAPLPSCLGKHVMRTTRFSHIPMLGNMTSTQRQLHMYIIPVASWGALRTHPLRDREITHVHVHPHQSEHAVENRIDQEEFTFDADESASVSPSVPNEVLAASNQIADSSSACLYTGA